jgi:FkbM family methyltransferase
MPSDQLEVLVDAEVFSVNGPGILFGSTKDTYFEHILSHPGLDIAGHNPIFTKVAEKLPPYAVIIDIGANIGVTTLPASRYVPQGRVIAVEPSPIASLALKRAIEVNNLSNCTMLNQCLGESSGEVAFVENVDFIAGSYIGELAREASTTRVAMTTLDSLVLRERLDRIDLIKIDVEGYELDVLKGAQATIERYSPLFVMEYNSFALTANRNLSPRALLDFIIDRFGCFQVSRNGEDVIISTSKSVRDFLYSNMTAHGCVEDIIFGALIKA